ncbi:MAG: primosomal protein N' [Lentisphaeria bacterium]|nr:primosomal protein N' [Lentisphaeria bacterium]
MKSLPKIAKVLLDLSLDRSFDYAIPPDLAADIRVGMKVNVPFGNGKGERTAYVVAFAETSPYPTLKPILSLCEDRISLPDSLIRLGEWMADYYCCARESAIRNLLPGAVRNGKVKQKTENWYFLADRDSAMSYITANAKAKARCAVLKVLLNAPGGMESVQLQKEAGTSASVLKKLLDDKVIMIEERGVERDPFKGVKVMPTAPKEPNEQQAEALQIIKNKLHDRTKEESHVVLMHGVTGSGKTEVYLQSIAEVIAMRKEAIMLVPEISLTPQTVGLFRARFGDELCVLHSGLSDGERYDEWMKVQSGKVKIAVGARSALFAPFRNLALIIVDEEHDTSYKQSEAPRYNARDVAVVRGKLENALVLLGSATPSVESYHNATTGKYTLVKMTKRYDPTVLMPSVSVVDMRLESDENGRIPFFSKGLIQAIRDRIGRGEQSIVFLNRRGFARQMNCPACGYIAMCSECSVALTYHRRSQMLSCHFCAGTMPAPEICPECGSHDIRYQGNGTERIENIFEELFRGARIARMDSDTMTRPSLYEKTLASFRKGEIDILIGTQMIAKGLDFPNVTFVGVVNADLGLYVPGDFRAQEHAFQLLTQVAGRAGRGEIPGEVLIQTCAPFNSAIQYAVEHDYDGFFKEEIMLREELAFPPFGHMMIIHFRGEEVEKVQEAANALMTLIRPYIDPDTRVTEPAPATVERIAGKYRYTALFMGGKLAQLRRVIKRAIYTEKHPGVDIYVDMDAISFL